jgi:hypothetical protein
VLRQLDDLIEMIFGQAAPSITKCRVDREERLAVGPESADVDPWLLV